MKLKDYKFPRGPVFTQVDWDVYDNYISEGFSNIEISGMLLDKRTGKKISKTSFYRALKRRWSH